MSVSNVRQVERVEQSRVAPERSTEWRRRLELFSAETWEKHAGKDYQELSRFALPVSGEQAAAVTNLYAGLGATDRQHMAAASVELASAIMQPGAVGATGGLSQGLKDASSAAIATYVLTSGSEDLSAMNQGFMNMAIGGMEYKLHEFATAVQENTEITRGIRTEATELRDMMSDWPAGETREFTWHEVTYDENGKPTVTEHTEQLTKAEAEQLLGNLDTWLQSANDINEIVKFDLQKFHQEYQQGVQTLTTIMKQVNDDMMKIINNIKG
jgi:hypothetical protein